MNLDDGIAPVRDGTAAADVASPPGHRPGQEDQGQAEQYRLYEAYAEDWSQRFCVKARSNVVPGAVIGGRYTSSAPPPHVTKGSARTI